MAIISYKRSFTIQIAHWNSQEPYDYYWEWLETKDFFPAGWYCMARESHGHDLRLEIEITADMPEGKDWIVDDIELEKLVKQWHNQNVSMNLDFAGSRMRATTENMAHILVEKIHKEWPFIQIVEVAVHEGPDIVAKHSSNFGCGENFYNV